MTATELVACRDQLGWSLTEAAEQLGITRRAYIYLEGGESSSGRKIEFIPRSYELTCAELTRRYGSPARRTG